MVSQYDHHVSTLISYSGITASGIQFDLLDLNRFAFGIYFRNSAKSTGFNGLQWNCSDLPSCQPTSSLLGSIQRFGSRCATKPDWKIH